MPRGWRARRGASSEEMWDADGAALADRSGPLDGPGFAFEAGAADDTAPLLRGGGAAAELKAARDRSGPVLLEARAPLSGTPTPADPIILRLDEPVRAGSGAFRLAGEDGVIRIAARDVERVTISGDTVQISLGRPLEPGASYSLELGRKALRDLAGNPLQPVRAELLPVIEVQAPDAPETVAARWTLMVYMAADNDLERYALLDLAEMERVTLPDSVQLVALVDRSPWYVAGPGDFTDTRLGPVRPDGDPNIVGSGLVSIGERNTGDPATLTAFLDWARATFPAERYGLVIWDHGGGLDGAAWDGSSRGDHLTLAEMRLAIAQSTLGRVDLLGFDACLMAMAEVASELSGVAEVMVASQELEPSRGWPYDRILAELAERPSLQPRELGAAIVEAYAEAFSDARDITLSALDLGAMSALESALRDFAGAVERSADGAELAAIAAAAEAARPFPRDGSYPYRDLGGFLDRVAARIDDPTIDAAARRAREALDRVVTAEGGNVPGASGLAVHLPAGEAPAWPGYEPSSFSFLARTGWDDLVDRLIAVA